jgi:hypothetical protein
LAIEAFAVAKDGVSMLDIFQSNGLARPWWTFRPMEIHGQSGKPLKDVQGR